MASQNILLSPGGINVSTTGNQVVHEIVVNKKSPAWRYNKDYPLGKIFKTDADLKHADSTGWVDHPGKVNKLPGHEKIFDKINEKPVEVPKIDLAKSEDAIKADELKTAADKAEKKRLEDLEKTKTPTAIHACLVCGKTFDSEKALHMHGVGAHRNKKDLTLDEKNIVKE